MFAFVNDNFLYIKCPRNGCTTFTTILSKNGWKEINLFENDLDLSKMRIWAHITDPHQRHTKGLHKYFIDNPEIDLNNPMIAKMLVSGVFDEHTYSLSMMLNHLWHLDIHWIPLDAEIIDHRPPPYTMRTLDGDDLTNDFFRENGINLMVSKSDHLNRSSDQTGIRDKINKLKELYHDNYQKIVKNFLEPDIILYYQTLEKYRTKYQ